LRLSFGRILDKLSATLQSNGSGGKDITMNSEAVVSSARVDAALLLIRIASALAFLYHGAAILFGSFGGPGPVQFAAFMHAPPIVGYLVGLAQFAGGLAILTGVLFRVGTVCVMIVMLGAIFLVHWPHGFNVTSGGMEYALTQFLIALALFLVGPGAYSLAPVLPAGLRKL
jgi:putative oxidoreductase